MTLAIQLAIAAALLAVGAWGGIEWEQGRQAMRAADEAMQKGRTFAARAKQGASAAKGHEGDRERLRTQFLTITERVEYEVEKPVYRNVCVDPDGLRILSDAIDAAAVAAGKPADAVPAADEAR